jgi:hypothetical protein
VSSLLKLILAPYFLLGMTMGAAFSKHSSWHPGLNAFLVLGTIHILLIGCTFFLVSKSKQKGARLSPSGLAVGQGLAYFAGFLVFFRMTISYEKALA